MRSKIVQAMRFRMRTNGCGARCAFVKILAILQALGTMKGVQDTRSVTINATLNMKTMITIAKQKSRRIGSYFSLSFLLLGVAFFAVSVQWSGEHFVRSDEPYSAVQYIDLDFYCFVHTTEKVKNIELPLVNRRNL